VSDNIGFVGEDSFLSGIFSHWDYVLVDIILYLVISSLVYGKKLTIW